MKLEENKLKRFLHDGHGLERASIVVDQAAFEATLKRLLKEIRDTRGPFVDRLDFFAHILESKKIAWMEGEQGWTTWIEDHDDILD